MALLEKHLVVKKSTLPNAGKGLFTKIAIPKNTRIVEYKGRRTIWKDVANDDTNGYIYSINRNNVIDAQKTLSALARYANDARGISRVKGVTNNCVYVNDNGRAYIESVKHIPAGAEIFVDYTKEYWDVMRHNIKVNEKEKREAEKENKTAKKTSLKKVGDRKRPRVSRKAA
jgi:uncharacterized protein